MALLFSMDILAWLARISLLCLKLRKQPQYQFVTLGYTGLCSLSNTSLSPFVDELQLHGLLFLNGGQEFLEVFTLLCDVAILHLLLLVAVAVDQL